MSKKTNEKIIKFAHKKGMIRARDLAVHGIARKHLLPLVKEGKLIRSSRGLYYTPDIDITEKHSLVEVHHLIPKAVISLVSALRFHNIGTQNPHQVWIALKRLTRTPKIEYPPIRVFKFSDAAYKAGIEYHDVQGTRLPVYNVEKTIADCFKYRNKIGLDVAIEALRDAWEMRLVTVEDLWKYAKICRVTNIIRPYMEAIQ